MSAQPKEFELLRHHATIAMLALSSGFKWDRNQLYLNFLYWLVDRIMRAPKKKIKQLHKQQL